MLPSPAPAASPYPQTRPFHSVTAGSLESSLCLLFLSHLCSPHLLTPEIPSPFKAQINYCYILHNFPEHSRFENTLWTPGCIYTLIMVCLFIDTMFFLSQYNLCIKKQFRVEDIKYFTCCEHLILKYMSAHSLANILMYNQSFYIYFKYLFILYVGVEVCLGACV